MRLLIDYEAGGMHAKFIHSTKAALIDYRITWRENVIRRERERESDRDKVHERERARKERTKAKHPYLAAEQRCA